MLLESSVDRRADVGDVLPEIDRGDGALGNALRCELELLQRLLAGVKIPRDMCWD